MIVYVLSVAAGALTGFALPEGPWTPFVPIMLGYHLFLIYLLMEHAVNNNHKLGFSLMSPLVLITHVVFLAALAGFVLARYHVPMYEYVRYLVPALSLIEAWWLFEMTNRERKSAPTRQPLPPATMEEYTAFTEYLAGKNRKFHRPGKSLQREFKDWQTAHQKRAREKVLED